MSAGWLINNFRLAYSHIAGCNMYSCLFIQSRDYAARKGTREKAKKKKIKIVVEKVGFIPHNERISKAEKVHSKMSPLLTLDDSWKRKPVDDVWIVKYHQKPVYSLKEAVECHRELHHPTMYNKPNAFVNAYIELNLQREKKTKTLERFTKLVDTPYIFQLNDTRSVLALSKSKEDQNIAKESGADFAGGVELIKQIQAGDFSYKEFDYIVAHPNILPDLIVIRGLLRKKFPNVHTGTLGTDIGILIERCKRAIQYTAQPDKTFKNYGVIDVAFGTLDMEINQLEKNFSSLINNVYSMKPRREGIFIPRVQISCSTSGESFKINFDKYLPMKAEETAKEEEEEEVNTAVISTH
ncbi:mitochondrial ribosomal protein L1 isoform X1 [Colletes latitarsis]|uniref:mitochondrial ribosomal protein L1 isoform X1 n=2 Tax=Colletes latitarsis TaxID=2605962 RepID=UPI004036D6E3